MARVLSIALVCALPAIAAAAPSLSVGGEPICGSFAVRWLPDELRQAQQAGINLVFCYERPAGDDLLDPATELGQIALAGGTGVIANFLRYAHGASLTADLTPDQMTIPTTGVAGLPDAGVLWIDDEAIRYESKTGTEVSVAERGFGDSEPAAHAAGTHLFEESILREHLERVKDSPNLWGFWVLDDKRGDQRAALRNLYRLIREWDVDAQGNPLGHVVVAGFANSEALTNFERDCCDAAGVYIYPSRRGAFGAWEIEDHLREMVPVMRERDPDVRMIGIYQAFYGPRYEPRPTPMQVRQQVTDFLRWGAAGVMAYSWRMIEPYNTLRNTPDLRAEVTRIAAELRSGALQVDQTPPQPPPTEEYATPPGPLVPLVSPSPDMTVPPTAQALTAELGDLEGHNGTWLHLRFDRYEEGAPEWPGVGFVPSAGLGLTDWSAFGGLIVRVANPMDVDSEVGVAIISTQGGMWARYFPLPAGEVTDVPVDLAAVGRTIPLGAVGRLTLLMRRPPVETHLALQGCYLAPLRFEVDRERSVMIPRTAGDAPWQGAAAIDLHDESGADSIKPCTVRLARTGDTLHVRFECAVPDPSLLRADDTESDADLAAEDAVEVLLRPAGGDRAARLRVNALGTLRDELLDRAGAHRDWDSGAFVETATEGGQWHVTIGLPLTSIGDAPPNAWQADFRRIDTELRSLAWAERRLPGGEVLGEVILAP